MTKPDYTMAARLLDAMPDPVAVDEHWRRICREMTVDAAAVAYEQGYGDGYVTAIADAKAAQHRMAREADLELTRWTLRGEARTRETFADPHPDDYTGAET